MPVQTIGRIRKTIAISAGLLVLSGLVVWIVHSISIRTENIGGVPQHRTTATALRDPSHPEPTDVPIAMLCDYYEHGVEHAPPRDPSGVMQRREQYYLAPANPLKQFQHGSGQTAADSRLRSELVAWEADWRKGLETTPARLVAVEQFAAGSSLDATALLDAGRAFDWLDGDRLAAALFRAALAKAQRQYANTEPGDPVAIPLLRAVDQTKALWRTKDYGSLQRRFRMARALNRPMSPEARRAGYLVADCLFSQREYAEAAEVMTAVRGEDEKAGDLGALERSDVYEMNYATGLMLHFAGRYDEAIPLLEKVKGGGEHDEIALRVLMQSLLSLGRVDEAEHCYKTLVATFSIPKYSRQVLEEELAEARQ